MFKSFVNYDTDNGCLLYKFDDTLFSCSIKLEQKKTSPWDLTYALVQIYQQAHRPVAKNIAQFYYLQNWTAGDMLIDFRKIPEMAKYFKCTQSYYLLLNRRR